MTQVQTKQIKKRGCGWPVAGKAYIEVQTGRYGTPVWNFMLCSPVPLVDHKAFGINEMGMFLKPRGMVNKEGKEIFDLYDWIGEGHYPNVLDWVLEVEQLGFHQLANQKQLVQLVDESLYFGVHNKGWINDPEPYFQDRQTSSDYPVCPQDHDVHITPTPEWLGTKEMCAGLYSNDIVYGLDTGNRGVTRQMPSFS